MYFFMFGWFSGGKKEADKVREESRKAFDAVKKDIDHVGKWIRHLNSKDGEHHEKISEFDMRLATIEKEMGEIKNLVSGLQEDFSSELFKQPSTAVYKQRAVEAVEKVVQTPVQTGVEATFLFGNGMNPLAQLTAMERALIYVLLNSDLKLSYEDLSVILGKDKSTMRSQVNAIRQKCVGLLEEHIEKNGKKRVYIPEEIKQKLVKKAKMRGVKRTSKDKRDIDEEK